MDCIWIHFTTTFRGGQPPRFCIATLLQVKLIKCFANVYRSICLQYDVEIFIKN